MKYTKGEAALREEFLKRGESLYKDKRVLGAVIKDFFVEDQRLLKVLRLAVQENIAAEIAKILSNSVGEQKMRLSAVVSYFAGDYEMSEARVAEVVRVLAFCAGVEEEVLEGLAKMTSAEKPQQEQKPDQPPMNLPKPKPPQIGSILPFAGYNWRVLDIQGNQVLLLSDLILEKRAYHKDWAAAITWEQCTMRQYLNNDFYNKLPDADKSRIAQRTVQNPDNTDYGTKGGNDTSDRVFLFSIEEAERYFNHDEERVANFNGTASWWWLRSPGLGACSAASVNGGGQVFVLGISVFDVGGGVRPALWLNL